MYVPTVDERELPVADESQFSSSLNSSAHFAREFTHGHTPPSRTRGVLYIWKSTIDIYFFQVNFKSCDDELDIYTTL